MVSLVKNDWMMIFLEKSADTLKKLFTITDMAVDYYKTFNFMVVHNDG